MKKVFILFLSLTLLLFSSFFASAAVNHYYSNLPEPIVYDGSNEFDTNIRWIVADRDDGLVLFKISYPPFMNVNISFSNNQYHVNCTNVSTNLSGSLILTRYDALNGAYQATYSYTINALSNRTVSIGSPYSMVLYGLNYFQTNGVKLTNISWSDTNNPATYENWLQNIYTRQGSILQDLELFYNAFDTFRQFNHYDLTQIYSKLSDIFDLLSEDSELSTAPVDDFSNAVEEYNSVEDQIMVDYKSDVDLQFQKSDQVFTGNNAFALISSTFTDLFVNGNIKINALILFTLCLGLGVLLIGRKLNA